MSQKTNRPVGGSTGPADCKASRRSNHHTSPKLGLKAPQKATEADTALASAWRKALARKAGAR